jgi:hypothetical protein
VNTMTTQTERRAPSEDGDVRLYGASRLRDLARSTEGDTERGILIHAAHLLDGGVVEDDEGVPILKVIRDRVAGRMRTSDAPALAQDVVDLIDVLRQS